MAIMKLAVMQPYFFPYLGYFDLINMVDEWIVFDTAQYMRHNWVNRNRVLHPHGGWQYIIVPIKSHRQATPINQIEISDASDWRSGILRQFLHYKKEAPHFADVMAFLEDCLSGSESSLARFNVNIFRKTCQKLGIDRPIRVFSEMNLTLGPIHAPQDWALRICQAVGASEYINRPGGAGLFDENAFMDCGIKLTIQSFENMTYPCGRRTFIPDLSIIDVMMWNSPEQIKYYMDAFRSGNPNQLVNG
jgi:hypothetical protein